MHLVALNMGGGLMQLMAMGIQNQHLNDAGGTSYFRQKYSRHTNFAVESIDQTFDGPVGFGQKMACTLTRHGDLCLNLVLEIKLKRGDAGVDTFYCAEHLVKSVELQIGGTRIDFLTNTYLRLYDELHRPIDLREAYRHMTDFFNEPAGTVKRFFVPLPFWFCNDPASALPLIGLQYHETKLFIEFEEASAIPGIDASYEPQATLWGDFIFLDTDERRWFAHTPHEYLIEQVQMHREPIVVASTSKQHTCRLAFNHPIKYMAWVLRPSTDSHGLFTASSTGLVAEEVYGPLAQCGLQLNGVDRMKPRHGSYFRLQHPWSAFGQAPSVGVYAYSFAMFPQSKEPSAALNLSRIDEARLVLTTKAAVLDSEFLATDDDQTVKGSTALTILEVYARTFNSLRITNGMAGLMYST